MTGNARVKFDLLNGVQRVFKFKVKGLSYDHIENQIAVFAQRQKNKYANKIKMLTWEVQFKE
jgi:hypothetical protein|tara:strand:+ start:368 stop:553 length:186 start_codon:yes stop_codon:yes gene_type:complete